MKGVLCERCSKLRKLPCIPWAICGQCYSTVILSPGSDLTLGRFEIGPKRRSNLPSVNLYLGVKAISLAMHPNAELLTSSAGSAHDSTGTNGMTVRDSLLSPVLKSLTCGWNGSMCVAPYNIIWAWLAIVAEACFLPGNYLSSLITSHFHFLNMQCGTWLTCLQ